MAGSKTSKDMEFTIIVSDTGKFIYRIIKMTKFKRKLENKYAKDGNTKPFSGTNHPLVLAMF